MTTGMLDATAHERIIKDMERVCSTAGIQSHFLNESMKNYCGDVEVEWVKRFWKHKKDGIAGLALVNISRPDTRCQAIAAALIRNYVDARVVPLNSLIESATNGNRPAMPTVLLIPNLYLKVMSNKVHGWRVQVMYDLLLERATKSKPTVVYVESMQGLGKMYGAPFRDFLSRFVQVVETPPVEVSLDDLPEDGSE